MRTWEQVGQIVKDRREELGLTQEEAAQLAGVSLSGWRVFETGTRDSYRSSTLRGVCRALGWSPDSIDRLRRGQEPLLASARAGPTLRRRRRQTEIQAILDEIEDLKARVEDLLDEEEP